jgi:hypothetical protein
MKLVVNKCYGGFGLSPIAILEYLKLKGKDCFFYKQNYDDKLYHRIELSDASNYDLTLTKDYGATVKDDWKAFEPDYFYYGNIERTDLDLVKVVEMLGEKQSSGSLSELRVVEIPDGVQWELDEYDGIESIHEVHRSW